MTFGRNSFIQILFRIVIRNYTWELFHIFMADQSCYEPIHCLVILTSWPSILKIWSSPWQFRRGHCSHAQRYRIDPLFLQIKISLSLSHLIPEIIWPKVALFFHKNLSFDTFETKSPWFSILLTPFFIVIRSFWHLIFTKH